MILSLQIKGALNLGNPENLSSILSIYIDPESVQSLVHALKICMGVIIGLKFI